MFDLGIADLMLLGPADQEVYLVEFRCVATSSWREDR